MSSKKPGVEFESIEDFTLCFKRNSDGTGFAWTKEGRVHWSKGFMTLETALAEYERLKSFLTKDDFLTIHHRIGTHGSKGPDMTHPFPASSDPEALKATSGATDLLLFHNGICANMPTDKDLSDTAVLVRDYLAPLHAQGVSEDLRNRIINQLKGSSRIVLMDKAGGAVYMGDWTTKPNGLMYSNTSWEPYVAPVTTHTPNYYGRGYSGDDGWGERAGGKSGGYHQSKKDRRKRSASDRDSAILFETYELTANEVGRLHKVNHPIMVDKMLIDPAEPMFSDLYVLDAEKVYQLANLYKMEYDFVGYLDEFGSNFATAEEFLDYMDKHKLLGLGA